MANGKRVKANLELRPTEPMELDAAVVKLRDFKAPKFDQTVNAVVHLGIDPKQADQALRGSLSLPHGIGQSRKVVAFCDEADVESAKAAGAIEAGGEELVKKIQDGWADFDVAVATPSVMKIVSRLGRVLGPQGKMPSPKAGTVNADIATAVTEYSAGKVAYRNDDGGNLHVPVGKASFEAEQLTDNIEAFLALVKSVRPATTKGTYVKRVCLTATMSPSVQIQVQ